MKFKGDAREHVGRGATAFEVLESLDEGEFDKSSTLLVKVKGQSVDLHRPLQELSLDETSMVLHPRDFSCSRGKAVYWHSAAHLLGQTLEELYPSLILKNGPPLESEMDANNQVLAGTGGFYYDAWMESPDVNLKQVRTRMMKHVKKKHRFERLTLTQEEALDMFKDNEFKTHYINTSRDASFSAYKVGKFVDLCRGPHVPHTGVFQGVALHQATSTHEADTYRIKGIAFPSKDLLQDYTSRTLEATQKDHRVISTKQKLFSFHPLSPGNAFYLPHGTVVYKRLTQMLRDEYKQRGFQEVMTPQLFSPQVFQQSGHLDNYTENMFKVGSLNGSVKEEKDSSKGEPSSNDEKEDKEETHSCLKPMNCPGHCLLYNMEAYSYNDLPLRLADFSPLHRKELKGALGGLTRLVRFHQDDAHIFCTSSQVEAELVACLDFIQMLYKDLFGFSYSLSLSTRPEKANLGNDEEWDHAEEVMRGILDQSGVEWSVEQGEGAFYGPKIDVHVTDALARKHQCATIQLDFQLPRQFNLEYTTSQGDKQQPVMIHRAVLGSLERFIAILLEHTNGKLPFWLSPRQICVIPVHDDVLDFAYSLQQDLASVCLHEETPGSVGTDVLALSVDVDAHTGKTLKKRVRDAQQAPYALILVVGSDEKDSQTVAVRSNDGQINVKGLDVGVFKDLLKGAVFDRTNDTIPSGLREVV